MGWMLRIVAMAFFLVGSTQIEEAVAKPRPRSKNTEASRASTKRSNGKRRNSSRRSARRPKVKLRTNNVAIGPNKPLGVGLYVGDINGISAKYWTTSDIALHAVLGTPLPAREAVVAVGGLYHMRDVIGPKFDMADVLVHLGGDLTLSAASATGGDSGLLRGLRANVGLTALLKNKPIELFVEITPQVGWSADNAMVVAVAGAAGGRYYF